MIRKEKNIISESDKIVSPIITTTEHNIKNKTKKGTKPTSGDTGGE
jgi:hypothetical protein